jgi:GNAT superfamily N-acetyltransferase
MSASSHTIRRVEEADLADLLGLMRAYGEFYSASPSDADLMALSRALLEDADCEGVQLLARDEAGRASGFATVYWSWSTTDACRIGVMNDLFATPRARGQGLAEALIEASRTEYANRGARSLRWQTAPENVRALAVYDRTGGIPSRWVDYSLPIDATPAP